MRKICFALPVMLFLGCLHSPQSLDVLSPDMEGFVSLFVRYEERCPYFAHKELDWAAHMGNYYPLASQCETEDEMAEVVADMMTVLQDPVICLRKYDELGTVIEEVYPYSREYEKNYDMDVLVEHYLEPNGWAGWEQGYIEGFGWCDPALLPYIFMNTMPNVPSVLDTLDAFITECIALNVPAVIIDVRMNPHSGLSYCGRDLMGRFAEKAYPGAIYRSRDGPEYDSYTDNRPVVYPAGPAQYKGTVIVLVGENCRGRSENMLASFINFPNVVLVGDTTGGSVSRFSLTQITDHWSCASVYRTILTYDNHWIEGAGLPPDIYVETTEGDFAAGVDPVLDYAIEMLNECR